VTRSRNKARIPVQKRSIETKEKIMNAAWTLFGEKGYFKTTSHDLAQRAGVAIGSFYGYFNNKKEVAIELIRNFYSETLEKALCNIHKEVGKNVKQNSDNGRKLVRSLIQSLREAHDINPLIHRDVTALILTDEDVNKINKEEEKKIIAFLVNLLEQYKQFIRVNDIEAAATMLFWISTEMIHRIMNDKEEDKAERLLRELEHIICSYLFIDVH
jgi:AcrR family transcriptional regulator